MREGVLYNLVFTEFPFKTVSGDVTACHRISTIANSGASIISIIANSGASIISIIANSGASIISIIANSCASIIFTIAKSGASIISFIASSGASIMFVMAEMEIEKLPVLWFSVNKLDIEPNIELTCEI